MMPRDCFNAIRFAAVSSGVIIRILQTDSFSTMLRETFGREECIPSIKKAISRPIVIKCLLSAISIIGFAAQVIQVSILYFGYKTTTQVKIETPAFIRTHGVALCIRYTDIIDHKRLNNETGLTFRPLRTLEDGIDQEDLLTVEQIFEYTPHENTLISKCFTRPDEWRYNFNTGSGCYKVFNVTRFMTLEYMCYSIIRKGKRRLTQLSVTQASFLQYKIYEVTMGPRFRQVISLIPIAFSDGLPFLSRDYTSILPHLRVANTDNFIYNIFHMYPSDLKFHLLPPPFDTMCFDAEPGNEYICNKECLITEYGKFDRAPGFEMLDQPYKRKVLSIKDLNDTVLLQKATIAYGFCRKKCFYKPCFTGFSKTTSRVMKDNTIDLRFSLLTSSDPDIVIIAQATMTFIEFFSFVAGCFGTWFGLSFLSLNPLNVLLRRKKSKVKISITEILPRRKSMQHHEPWRLMKK